MVDDLMTVYRDAVFEVDTGEGRIRIVLDEVNSALDELLSSHHIVDWAFITAWNPGELRRSRVENDLAQRLLEEQVRCAGLRLWPGDGASPDRQHVEVSILIGGIDLSSACALGHAFQQRAIVVGAVAQPAKLQELPVIEHDRS